VGQLLAYLPELRDCLAEVGGRAILLPNPTVNSESYSDPARTLAAEARQLGTSVDEARAGARREIADWLDIAGEPPERFDELLGHWH
jgi:hypothetical protein